MNEKKVVQLLKKKKKNCDFRDVHVNQSIIFIHFD